MFNPTVARLTYRGLLGLPEPVLTQLFESNARNCYSLG